MRNPIWMVLYEPFFKAWGKILQTSSGNNISKITCDFTLYVAILLNYFWTVSVKAWKQAPMYLYHKGRRNKGTQQVSHNLTATNRFGKIFGKFFFFITEDSKLSRRIFKCNKTKKKVVDFPTKITSGTPDRGSGQFDTFHIFSSTG